MLENLTDLEKDKLTAFQEDRQMFETVKKYLLAFLYDHGTIQKNQPAQGNINWAVQLAWDRNFPRSDAELGADLRAIARGLQVIESGFKELAEFKREEPVKEPAPEHL